MYAISMYSLYWYQGPGFENSMLKPMLVDKDFLSPVNSPHKGQWRGALMFSFICAWTNGWANHRDVGDLRRNRAHYDVTVMIEPTWRHVVWITSIDDDVHMQVCYQGYILHFFRTDYSPLFPFRNSESFSKYIRAWWKYRDENKQSWLSTQQWKYKYMYNIFQIR